MHKHFATSLLLQNYHTPVHLQKNSKGPHKFIPFDADVKDDIK